MSASQAPTAAPSRRGLSTRLVAAWGLLAVLAVVALAVATNRNPGAPTDAARATALKEHTLCPVCDGQNVLESNAPVAAAIRTQIDQLVDEGVADTEIRARLAQRFGDDVNALPPRSGFGALVWSVPVVVAIAAAVWLVATVRRWRRTDDADLPTADPEAESVDEPAEPTEQLAAGPAAGPDRVAAAAEATTSAQQATNPRWSRGRIALTAVITAAVAIGAGLAVAAGAGLARSGETISGETDRSARSKVFEAEQLFATGDHAGARELVDEALAVARDDREALVLSARLHEAVATGAAGSEQGGGLVGDTAEPGSVTVGAITSALADLQRVLDANPADAEALTLRGWLLVRTGDPGLVAQGVASLDAAVATDPTAFDPFVFRGYVARQLEGDLALAVEMYNQALQRDPPPAMAAQLTQRVAEMTEALVGERS